MKKICCLALTAMMFLLSSCSLGTLFNKSEAVNKNIDAVDNSVINPTAAPTTQASDSLTNVTNSEGSKNVSAGPNDYINSGIVNDELVPAAVIGGIPDDTWVEDGFSPVMLYLRDNEGFIIPVTQKAVNQQEIAKLTLLRLIDSTVNREELAQYGLYPTIPNGTEILGFTTSNGIVTIDFSSDFLNYKSDLDERSMISSIVYTMTQFQAITGVRLMCSGKKLPVMRFGTDASQVLYRANTMINADKLNVTPEMAKQDIYVFRNSTASTAYCLPVSYEYDGNASGTDFYKTIELMSQVDKKGLASLLPEGTRLIGSSIDKNTITLNFSKDLRRYAGNMREEAILRQLFYTFAQYKGITNIRIFIEGSQNSVLPEGTDLSESFKLSKAFNLVLE